MDTIKPSRPCAVDLPLVPVNFEILQQVAIVSTCLRYPAATSQRQKQAAASLGMFLDLDGRALGRWP